MLLENNPKEILQTLPVYTPTLLGLIDPEITAVVIRVESLEPFESEDLRLNASFAGYELDGTYLACVAFRVFDNPDDPLQGDAYLNPRQQIDRKALENLTVQVQLPFVFLSENLRREVVRPAAWREQNRAGAGQVLTASAGIALIEGSLDPEYQKAKTRFQARYAVKDLLS